MGEDYCENRKKRQKQCLRRSMLCVSYNWWSQVVKYGMKVPKHDSALPGYKWMLELWNGNDYRFFEQFRMRKRVMGTLLHALQTHYGLRPFKHVAIDESLAMFMLIIGHGLTFPNVTERLQHSGQTVSAHFHEVLAAVCRMGVDLIRPEDPTFSEVPPKLASDRRYYPAFAGCVGAIDGTHINVRLVGEHATPSWYDRHGVPSTTVLVCVDFNLCFTYAKLGSEGSMHDSRVMHRALNDPRRKFPMPPAGKYYLADSGFPNRKGFLVPYRRTRYHIPDFRQVGIIRGRNENFNYLHSSLRSMVERSFGILKARFKILPKMTNFDMKTQMRIIWATLAIHNYLRRYDGDDLEFLGQIEVITENDNNDNEHGRVNELPSAETLYMDNLRDHIRDSLPMRRI